MVSHQGATMSHTATVSHTAASHSCPSTVWACSLAVQSLCASSVALQASQTHSQLASPLSQRVPANVHLTANVSALGFTVSACKSLPASTVAWSTQAFFILALAFGPAVLTSGRSERVILAMRVIMGGPVTRGMVTASRPEARGSASYRGV